MGNSSLRNAVTNRKRTVGGDDAQSKTAESGPVAPPLSESVVLLESRRRKGATSQTAAGAVGAAEKDDAELRRSKEIGDQIGKELRGLYADLVAQPVPDRFLDLLNELEAKTISSQTTSKSPGER